MSSGRGERRNAVRERYDEEARALSERVSSDTASTGLRERAFRNRRRRCRFVKHKKKDEEEHSQMRESSNPPNQVVKQLGTFTADCGRVVGRVRGTWKVNVPHLRGVTGARLS